MNFLQKNKIQYKVVNKVLFLLYKFYDSFAIIISKKKKTKIKLEHNNKILLSCKLTFLNISLKIVSCMVFSCEKVMKNYNYSFKQWFPILIFV